ncbi:MAG: acyl carrier protein [Anaerolineae bacterium]|nr:acyl carrier protein [Anaerolineae bacterium]
MKDLLRQFILTELIRDASYPLLDDESLFADGLIDSFSLVQVGIFVEEQFGVHLDDVELTVENMDTIDKMVAYIQNKQ